MHIAIAAQYYWPEKVGAAIWLEQLATDLIARGHRVTMLTGFPNYPDGKIFEGYRGKWFQRESRDGVEIRRSFLFASEKQTFWHRALNFGSFCGSAFLNGLRAPKPDVLYAVLPPLPLGTAMEWASAIRGIPVVVNVQDIYPEIAVQLGYLKNRAAIRFFERMERKIYGRAKAIVVISDGFRENLLGKGVDAGKLHVAPNWADGTAIAPALRENSFRKRLALNGELCLIYSGNLSHNSSLEPLLAAARELRDGPYKFVFVGDGVHKRALESEAHQYGLENVQFLPFQPLEVYPEVLAASDLQVVSLHAAAGSLSLPSKVLKIMASGRPVLAIARAETELARLVRSADCGVCVSPESHSELAALLPALANDRARLQQMGENGRKYFLDHFERNRCVGQIEQVLIAAACGHKE